MSNPMTPDAIKLAIQKLEKIVAWNAFPVTNHFWDKEKTQRMSFGAANGSNGERDYMRGIAKEALTLLKSLTADAGEAEIKHLMQLAFNANENSGECYSRSMRVLFLKAFPDFEDGCECKECEEDKATSQGVCGECKGAKNVKRTVNTENYGEQDFWDICGACNGSGKAPQRSLEGGKYAL